MMFAGFARTFAPPVFRKWAWNVLLWHGAGDSAPERRASQIKGSRLRQGCDAARKAEVYEKTSSCVRSKAFYVARRVVKLYAA
jgi:hypothetical protein